MEPQIRLMDSCSLCAPDGRVIGLPTRKSWGLLAYLCQAGGRDIPREELATLLWPRGNEGQARASLRQELAVLRKAMSAAGISAIHASKDRVRFAVPEGAVDTVEVVRFLAQGTNTARRAAVALYRGDFLRDLKVRAGPFEEWVWIERQRLKAQVVAELQTLLEQDLAGAEPERALTTAQRLLAIEPTQETAYRGVMGLLRQIGRRSEALQMYQRCVDVLRRDLDAAPSLDTVILADQIRDEAGLSFDKSRPVPQTAVLVILSAHLAGGSDLDVPFAAKELAQAQARFLERAKRVIGACGGILLPGLGDRILAIFGYPTPQREDRETAVQAALSLCSEPVSLSKRSVLWPRAGLARGEVLVSPPGPGGHGAVLVGGAVLRAGRLAQGGEGGHVVVANEMTERLNGRYELHPALDRIAPLADPGQIIRRGREGV